MRIGHLRGAADTTKLAAPKLGRGVLDRVTTSSSSEQVLRAQPRHVAALNVLGIVLTQQREFSEAETYLR